MEAEATETASGALAAQGLSLSHNGPQPENTRAAADVAPFFATFWDGGTAVEVTRNVPERSGAARVEKHNDKAAVARRKAQRNQVAPGEPQPGEQVGGGPRGRITGFSRQSRLRLLKRIHQLRKDTSALLVTLTLPDGVQTDGRALKRWLKAWWKRMIRRFPQASAMWRVESKARKTGVQVGEAVGHVHLLIYGVPMQPGLKEYISESWYQVVGSGDVKHLRAGTRVEAPRDWQRVNQYAAKLYAAKEGDADPVIPDVGRFWGFLAETLIPWATAIVVALSFREGFRLLRALRSYVRAERRAKGRHPPGRLTQWRAFFVGDASRWLDCAAAL